jgi:hypothetical protein
VAYTVQTTVDAFAIDFKESNLLKQYPKALRCYFAVSSCYFKLFLWLTFFQQPMVFIIKKKQYRLNRLYLL